jgi:hypothetical protein
MPNLDVILSDPIRNTLWLISGGAGGAVLKPKDVSKIASFNRNGGGLALWGDNDPYFHEANLVMQEMELGKMVGNFNGSTMVGPSKGKGTAGFNSEHPITFGVGNELHEGVTIAGLPENLLEEGWVEIMRASDKRLLTAYHAPEEGKGPVVLHGAFTQLYCNMTAKGQGPFVTNLGTYTVLRGGDTAENAV